MEIESIMALKLKLLNPKRGDKFRLPFYVDGWRMCDITVGAKWGFVRPVHGKTTNKRYTVSNLKKELKNLYWYAAKCSASREALEVGKPKRKRGWEKRYA